MSCDECIAICIRLSWTVSALIAVCVKDVVVEVGMRNEPLQVMVFKLVFKQKLFSSDFGNGVYISLWHCDESKYNSLTSRLSKGEKRIRNKSWSQNQGGSAPVPGVCI